MPDDKDSAISETELSGGLASKILRHWTAYRPKTVAALKSQGKLIGAVNRAADNHAQTYEEMRSHGLAHDGADEIAREPWIGPESNKPEPDDEDQAT